MVNLIKLTKIVVLPALLAVAGILLFTGSYHQPAPSGKGMVKISFINTVDHRPLVLNDSTYHNIFGEVYRVTKFKYYISNIKLSGPAGTVAEKNSYHLVDQSDTTSWSFSFSVSADTYETISFTIGVDSLKNVSGIQAGALDPANDMFWTWKSGYVMAKLEGLSPASTAINHRIEYHIGGYSGEYNAIKRITLPFSGSSLQILQNEKTPEILIETNLDEWWQAANPVKISDNPVCAVPGAMAGKIAGNYSKMFAIKKIISN